MFWWLENVPVGLFGLICVSAMIALVFLVIVCGLLWLLKLVLV